MKIGKYIFLAFICVIILGPLAYFSIAEDNGSDSKWSFIPVLERDHNCIFEPNPDLKTRNFGVAYGSTLQVMAPWQTCVPGTGSAIRHHNFSNGTLTDREDDIIGHFIYTYQSSYDMNSVLMCGSRDAIQSQSRIDFTKADDITKITTATTGSVQSQQLQQSCSLSDNPNNDRYTRLAPHYESSPNLRLAYRIFSGDIMDSTFQLDPPSPKKVDNHHVIAGYTTNTTDSFVRGAFITTDSRVLSFTCYVDNVVDNPCSTVGETIASKHLQPMNYGASGNTFQGAGFVNHPSHIDNFWGAIAFTDNGLDRIELLNISYTSIDAFQGVIYDSDELWSVGLGLGGYEIRHPCAFRVNNFVGMVWEMRENGTDMADRAILIAGSENGGSTFGSPQVITRSSYWEDATPTLAHSSGSCIAFDPVNQEGIVIFNLNYPDDRVVDRTYLAYTGNITNLDLSQEFIPPPNIQIIDAPSQVEINTGFSVTVEVTDSTGPVEGRAVGLITEPPTFLEIGFTGEDGRLTFENLLISTPGTYDLIAVEDDGDTDTVTLIVLSPQTRPGTDDQTLGTDFPSLAEKTQQPLAFLQFLGWIILLVFMVGFTFRATGSPVVTAAISLPVSVLYGVVFGLLQIWIMQVMVLAAGAIWVFLGSRSSNNGVDPVKIIIVWVLYFVFTSLLIGSGLADVPQPPTFEQPTAGFLDRIGLGGLNVLVQIIGILWDGVVFLFNIFTFNIGGTPPVIRVLITGLTTPSLFWAIAKLIRGT